MVLLGDTVTVHRTIAGNETYITGAISGIVLTDSGDLRYFYIRGLDQSIWMTDGWVFEEEQYELEQDDDEDEI